MKALDKSVETLGLWIVTSRLHSLNLQTRVASEYVWRNYFLWLLVILGNYPSDAQTIPTPRDDNWFILFSVFFIYLFIFYVATVLDVVDASPQSTIRSWTCSDVKTWLKNVGLRDRWIVLCFFILIPIPKALRDVEHCYSPLGNEMEWHTPSYYVSFRKLPPELFPLGSLELETRLRFR